MADETRPHHPEGQDEPPRLQFPLDEKAALEPHTDAVDGGTDRHEGAVETGAGSAATPPTLIWSSQSRQDTRLTLEKINVRSHKSSGARIGLFLSASSGEHNTTMASSGDGITSTPDSGKTEP